MRAKQQADELAAGFMSPESQEAQRYDRRTMAMFLRFFGRHRKPVTLSQRDWERFIRARRAGKVGPSGRPVSDRTVEYDLKFLMAILNWAARSRGEEGRLLLEFNPLRGLKLPKEKNPTRVVLTQEEYEVLLRVSPLVDWRFRVALVIAHETGHVSGDGLVVPVVRHLAEQILNPLVESEELEEAAA
ncbi:hypothetical protein [Candidatus Palauibacter sp.]|uniref:hypothetical protein n=1 Tax=Candidatus Palauibacter sp. TaxID=3101350 RepID=UPI003B520D61